MARDPTMAEGGEKPSNARFIAELQGLTLALRLVGLDSMRAGRVQVGPPIANAGDTP